MRRSRDVRDATDRAAAHFSVEYRVNLIERGVAFTDTIPIV